MEVKGNAGKKQTLLQDFQSMIESTIGSESDLRPSHTRPSISFGQLGTLLADMRTSRLLWAWERMESFEGQFSERLLDFEAERAITTMKTYTRKAISQTLSHWKRQIDRLSQLEQIQSAADMIARMNTFSKRFMACTVLHNLQKAKSSQRMVEGFVRIREKGVRGNPLKEVSFASLNCFTRTEPSLLSPETLHKWILQGTIRLHSGLIRTQLRLKSSFFKRLLRTKTQPTNESDMIERLEFEKAELAIGLQNKTNEVNRLVDMLEECKGWESKLSQIESGMKTESERWKRTALDLQEKLARKNEEIAIALHSKKTVEEETSEGKKEVERLKREMEEIKGRGAEDLTSQVDTLKGENETLNATVEDLKTKLQEQIQETLTSEKEKLLLLKRLSDKSSKKPSPLPKKSMQLERPSDLSESQLALEIVRLNREVNKYKYEARNAIETQKKAESERDELLRQIKVKNDLLEKLRKENDQLSVSLATDQYKSVQHLEMKAGKLKEQLDNARETISRMESERKGVRDGWEVDIKRKKEMEMELQRVTEELMVEKRKSEDQFRALQTLSSLQDRFVHLKEFGDKQILLSETIKREKLALEEQNEGLKASLRATKLHLDKASADADAYSRLLSQMESRLADCLAQKQTAEDEVRTLRSRLSKAITAG